MIVKFDYHDKEDTLIYVTFQSAGRLGSSGSNYYVYAGERVVLKMESELGVMQTLTLNGIKYLTDNDGILYYDATDEVRAAGVGNSFAIETEDPLITINLHPLNGINPESLLLPPTILEDTTGVQIVPPSVIYTHERLSKLAGLNFEVRGLAADGEWNLVYPLTVKYVTVENNRLTVPEDVIPDEIERLLKKDLGLVYNLIHLRECDNACVLKWRSASGIYRTAIWRIKQVKKTATSRELMPQGDEYLQQRGIDISFVAYIEGLNAYDYAYYADIITSSDIHCLINEGDNLDDEESRVAVSTDGYTALDGNSGELHNLEVEIKFRHYDTI